MPKDENQLKELPKHNKCSVCSAQRSYTNPLEKCFECKKRFCYRHIWGGQIKDGMKKDELVRNICESCRKSKGYKTIK